MNELLIERAAELKHNNKMLDKTNKVVSEDHQGLEELIQKGKGSSDDDSTWQP